MKKIFILTLVALSCVSCAVSAVINNRQLWGTGTHDIRNCLELTEKNKRQSIAVWGKYLISSHLNGVLYLYDLETKSLITQATIPVSSSILSTIHGSNVSFGVEFFNGNTIPVIYVCETTGEHRCFVVDLRMDGSITLVQTITFSGTWGTGKDYRDFIVDSQHRKLWIVGYYNYQSSDNHMICKEVKLRSIDAPTIDYQDSDVIDTFTVDSITVIQGCFIKDNHLFVGDQNDRIVNIDLHAHKIVGHIDCSPYTKELEGIAAYQKEMLVDLDGTIKAFIFN